MKISLITLPAFLCLGLVACSTPGESPDKTLAGAVLGAGWGAGAGAIVGHQIHDNTGPGVAVGAGVGLVGGAMAGYAQDTVEEEQFRLENELLSLHMQNLANRNELEDVQRKLDRMIASGATASLHEVYFGEDETDLRSGAIANLQAIADSLKKNPRAYKITVSGHTDDTGNSEYNQKVSESRARSVAAYLGARGISMDQIKVKGFGSTRPVASNSTQEGRQLNRRVEIFIGG